MSYEPGRVPWQEDVPLRGLRHRLTWWGERTSTPTVLLHGFLDTGATWQFLADYLPPSWTLVAPDWRGFGDTEWAPGGYWFPDYFADLDALLDHLVPQNRARVIGHSMGANIAKMYAGIRPHRLQWLVNLEGVGLSRTQPDQAPGRYAQWLDEERDPFKPGRYESAEQLATILRMRNPRLTADAAEFIAKAWTRPLPDGVELRFDPRHRQVNPILYRRDEAEACWARVAAPMLLVTGEVSEHRTRHGATHPTEQRTVTIPGCGHMMHHEDPATVAKHIVAFERDCAASTP